MVNVLVAFRRINQSVKVTARPKCWMRVIATNWILFTIHMDEYLGVDPLRVLGDCFAHFLL